MSKPSLALHNRKLAGLGRCTWLVDFQYRLKRGRLLLLRPLALSEGDPFSDGEPASGKPAWRGLLQSHLALRVEGEGPHCWEAAGLGSRAAMDPF